MYKFMCFNKIIVLSICQDNIFFLFKLFSDKNLINVI